MSGEWRASSSPVLDEDYGSKRQGLPPILFIRLLSDLAHAQLGSHYSLHPLLDNRTKRGQRELCRGGGGGRVGWSAPIGASQVNKGDGPLRFM
ncbi:hypothetical protein TNCV_2398391 [Trichonephila clavipes]|uniref:Uncharacterized protein n=1 Tax=Trichonephila clavipes TaxID=2585209 RepID=A0A8X6SRG1_TRICX|nr:hypothetical protein TNCV_2398391 [Trichonephila clavipes]